MVRQYPSYTNYSPTDLSDLRQSVLASKDPLVAVDTETTGFHWQNGDRAFGVALAWDNNCVFLRNSEYGADKIGLLLTDIFSAKNLTYCLHNSEFDFHMMKETYQVDPPQAILDTLRVSHLYDSSMSHALKDWGAAVYGKAASFHEGVIDEYRKAYKIRDYSHIPPEIMDSYAANDAVLTKSLAEAFTPIVQKDYPRLLELEHRLVHVIYEMERAGLRVDEEYTQRLRHELVLEKRQIEDSIYAVIGKPLEIGSSQQLARYFYERLGITPTVETSGGESGEKRASTGKEALEAIRHPVGTEVARLILKWRELEKIITTYLDPFLSKARNGRIHPRWNATGTITGRFSSSEPNFQNIPKDDRIRRCIVPDKEFIDMDFSQIELRVMAHVSEEQSMIDAFIAGEDLHALTASAIYGKSEVDDKERAIGKRINFGVIYGIGRKRLSTQAAISEKEAQAYLDRYWKVYPNIKKYFDSIIKSAKRRGYVETLFGRKVKIDEERPYAAVNYIVQGTAGDITKVSLLRTHNFLKNSGGTIQNTVHDSILFDNLEEDQIPKLKGIMENFNFDIPTPVDVMRSKRSWGDLVDA